MLWVMPWSFSSCWYIGLWYWQPWSEWKVSAFKAGCFLKALWSIECLDDEKLNKQRYRLRSRQEVKFSNIRMPLHVRPNGKEVAFDQIGRNLANSSFVAGIFALVASNSFKPNFMHPVSNRPVSYFWALAPHLQCNSAVAIAPFMVFENVINLCQQCRTFALNCFLGQSVVISAASNPGQWLVFGNNFGQLIIA